MRDMSIKKNKQCHKLPAWKVRINGCSTSFIPGFPISRPQVLKTLKARWPGYKIEVGV